MIRKILQKDDPVLHKVCHPVTQFDGKLAGLLEDLTATLEHANGLGLAAPQIGILRRVCVVMDQDETYLELVNPQIVEQEGEQEGLEGCLSLPGKWGYVKRPEWVKVKAQDRTGAWLEVEGTGLTARCFCHECDHLDGLMYVSKVEGELMDVEPIEEEEEELE